MKPDATGHPLTHDAGNPTLAWLEWHEFATPTTRNFFHLCLCFWSRLTA